MCHLLCHQSIVEPVARCEQQLPGYAILAGQQSKNALIYYDECALRKGRLMTHILFDRQPATLDCDAQVPFDHVFGNAETFGDLVLRDVFMHSHHEDLTASRR